AERAAEPIGRSLRSLMGPHITSVTEQFGRRYESTTRLGGMPAGTVSIANARELSDVVNQLRRALRRSIRTDYPWEARPTAQIEVLQSIRDTGATRIGDLAERLRLAQSTVSELVSRLVSDELLARA